MSISVTVMGCGSSGGVPRVGGDWGACNPANPKNRRQRCSILLRQHVDQGETTVIIDTSPDMRAQVLAAQVKRVDGVWYTHEHADHTHGIDELRGFYLRQRERIPVWADIRTADMLRTRFAYCFSPLPGSDYPPILDLQPLTAGKAITTAGAGGKITAVPFAVQHGTMEAMGFRIGAFAYTPDINDVPDQSRNMLEGLDIWLVDALRMHAHPSHFCLSDTLTWIERLKPRHAILTNMHLDLDYDTLRAQLPENVEPAFDGMTFTI